MIEQDQTPTPVFEAVSFTCRRILTILLKHRRGMSSHEHSDYALQLQQIQRQVARNETLLLTLPAFPCKSPNRHKVLGELPDMAERMSLRFLKQLCDDLTQLYPPGAHILICSDGHVFGDLIQVSDTAINNYAQSLAHMIEQENISCITVFHLGHVYGQLNYHQKRQRLIEEWGRPINVVRQELLGSETQLQLYRGITRFLFEDTIDSTSLSRSALQRQSRLRALSVIQRSQAWGNLLGQYHPRSVRLSIHPQPAHSAKLGIMLLSAPDIWLTPWHAVLVQSQDGLTLMKHHEAKQIGKLVQLEGRPSHYLMTGS